MVLKPLCGKVRDWERGRLGVKKETRETGYQERRGGKEIKENRREAKRLSVNRTRHQRRKNRRRLKTRITHASRCKCVEQRSVKFNMFWKYAQQV